MEQSFNDFPDIPREKLQFADIDDRQSKTKEKHKSVGFWRESFSRFAKNKASIAAFVIIVFLVLFAIFVPIFSPFSLSDRDGNLSKLLPKVSLFENTGFWDGTRVERLNERNLDYFRAMGTESGKSPIKKIKSVERVGNLNYYNVRIDSYLKVGYKFLNLTKSEYEDIQAYQRKSGVQVLFPMIDPQLSFDEADANFWYQTDGKGGAILGENGAYTPIYASTNAHSAPYDSTRIEGDDGSLIYAEINQTGYSVRVNYNNYYVYMHGFEPEFAFGTNSHGQDLLVCLAYGARFSLILSLSISLINLTLGAIYGAIEGYYGGTVDITMERICDVLSGVPFIIVVTLFQMHLGSKLGTIPSLLFAFVLTGWIGMASAVRTQFYRFKGQEYVLAARTLGAKDSRIILKHIFPNTLGTLITRAVLIIPSVIFSESILSYLGIVNFESSGLTSIGTLLSGGQQYISTFPHIVLFPALFLSLLMISFNLFGNGLRDAFNPASYRG
jgi:oligopeptide transport system permease protein